MSIKLTPKILRKMVAEERSALLEESRKDKKVVATSTNLENKLDYLKKLKIKEADLRKRLDLVSKTRSLLKNKVTEEL